MAKTTGLGDNFYVGGTDLSGATSALSSIHGGPAALDVTTINQSAVSRLGGLRDAGMDFTVFMDAAAGKSHSELAPLARTDTIGTYFRGTALGSPAASINAKQVNYDPTRGTDGSLTLGVSLVPNQYGLEWGTQLTPGITGFSNLLTGDSSNFEGGTANWVQSGNATIAQTAAQAHSGTKSLSLTSVTSGAMGAACCLAANIDTQGFTCSPGDQVYVQAWFRTAISARTVVAQIDWYDASKVSLGSSAGATSTDSAAGWVLAQTNWQAPASAAFFRVSVQINATGGASEVHYIDDVVVGRLSASGSLDNGSSTAFGVQAYLHVFSFTGTDATIKLQHSTVADTQSSSSFADIAGMGFTQITSGVVPFSQRLATANNVTINRFTRAVVTSAAGFTALSYAVMLVRNQTAVTF